MSDLWNRIAKLSEDKRRLLQGQLEGPVLQKIATFLPALLPRMTVEEMNREAVLHPSVTAGHASPARGSVDSILLSGATGFLGAYLLEALLEKTTASIHCLVRAENIEHGRQRIIDNLKRYLLNYARSDRIVPIPCDLALPRFGLSARQFDDLADRIDLIYHCGAVVKWTYPFRALKPANVDGTHWILRFAVQRHLKPVHFISSVGVFSSPHYPAKAVLESEPLDNSGPLYVGYAQTKWISEKLVTIARSRGVPVAIYRPNLASDSRNGVFNPHDHISLMIKCCIQLGGLRT